MKMSWTIGEVSKMRHDFDSLVECTKETLHLSGIYNTEI